MTADDVDWDGFGEVPDEDGRYPGVPDEVYFADRSSLSPSGAKLLLPPSCPAKFKEAQDNPLPPKREFTFGHVVHQMLLGAGPQLVVLDPNIHGRKKDGGIADNPAATAAWKAAAAAALNNGKVPVHVDSVTTAAAMVDAVMTDPDAGPLFKRGHSEVSLYHTDPETGIRLRGRADWMTCLDDGRLTIIDYKTTVDANPATWGRKSYDYGYHLQFAWYVNLARRLRLHSSPAFLFVCQEKTPPYLVSVNELDAEAFALGCRDMRRAISIYADCVRRDRWPGYGEGIHPVSLPPWAFSEQPTIADLLDDEE